MCNEDRRLSLVLFNNDSVGYSRQSTAAAVTSGCMKTVDLCVGDIVIDSDDDDALVTGIFNNGMLSLSLKANPSVRDSRDSSSLT